MAKDEYSTYLVTLRPPEGEAQILLRDEVAANGDVVVREVQLLRSVTLRARSKDEAAFRAVDAEARLAERSYRDALAARTAELAASGSDSAADDAAGDVRRPVVYVVDTVEAL